MLRCFNILVSPLDWGLGHATRCIPIISYLTKKGCNVFIAAEGNIKALLENEFPCATFLPLSGYNIRYSRQKKWLPLKIFAQIPRILYSIFEEHQWLKKTIKDHSITAVISDNRFGLYNCKVPCVYITHQLFIKTGNSFTEQMAGNINRFFINKFTECWVPDFKGNDNIAGQLSHPHKLPNSVKFIGCLSRFNFIENVKIKYDLLILLSGPEPQRTILEKILLLHLKEFEGAVLLVRGLPGNNIPYPDFKFIKLNTACTLEIKNHLGATELNLALQQAETIISRSGYTTVMDLLKLKKKAILIPTPGQTEQEYLAKYLMERKMFYSVIAGKFVLSEAIKNAAELDIITESYKMNQYEEILDEFLKNLKKEK